MLLSWTDAHGYHAVVKLLIHTGRIEFSSVDINGRMLLSWATRKGHGAVVEVLLDIGAATASGI